MEIIISNNSSKPIYEQITSQMKSMIMNGQLQAGDAIPSMRALAKSLHISVITVQKAYEDLQRDGFIETTVGRGSFVSARNRDFYQEEQQRKVEEFLQEAVETARACGIPLEKLQEILALFYEESEEYYGVPCAQMGENMVSALQITDLTKEYPGFKLDHVSFTLPQGTIMGLIGENGAGKSTTINAILDLIKRDEGSVTFWGEELSKNPRQLKENIGVVFDGINFYETLTPAKVGKISAAAYRQWNPVVYKDYLDKFQLPSNQEIKTFSKGMKMKLCIANALSHDSKLLILDEATSGLDPVMRDDILDIFLDYIQDENHSILMSSHITTDLEKIADYVTFIHEGKIVFSKTKDELIYNYGILRCSKDDFDRIDPGDILAYRKEDYQWNVLVADRDKAMARYRNVIVDHPTIDDILLLYVKGEAAK